VKYRKKPVVIEAWQIPPNDGKTRGPLPPWLISALATGDVFAHEEGFIEIHTREGVMTGNVGDWIIQGVKGELYPCKPDIFAASYEADTEGKST
jgi:hypothetical protein